MIEADGRPASTDDGRPHAPSGRGAWCVDADTSTVVRLARSGFDWVCLDLQHGRYDRADLVAVARSLPSSGAALVVRVRELSYTEIGAALDAGARAVIVPRVETPEQAAAAVEACHHPPLGRRSFGPTSARRGSPGSAGGAEDRGVTCAVMIESAAALVQVHAIAEAVAVVPGAGMLFVDPFELALSLGTTVEAMVPDLSPESPIARIRRAGQLNRVRVGAYGGDPRVSRALERHRIGTTAWASDDWILDQGVRAAQKAFR